MTRNNNLLAAAVAVAFLTPAITSFAQDRGEHGRDSHQDARHEEHGNGHRVEERRPPPRVVRREVRRDVRIDERRDGLRGAGPDHSYYRGGRLPTYYRSNQYVVDDWRGHRLSAPPRGYHWVQTGSDYVLVAVATGIIASILLSN